RSKQTLWAGQPYSHYYRAVHREFVQPTSERTVQSCLIPPGPTHVHALNSIRCASDYDTVRLSGLMMALPIDYLIKSLGGGHINVGVIDALPVPSKPP